MKEILKQTSWLFIAQSLTKIISFFYMLYLARILGVSDFGLYTIALAYFSIVSSFSDLGFNRYLIREVAQDRSKVTNLIWNILLFRLTIASIIFAIFSVFLYMVDADRLRVGITLVATLAVLPQSMALTLDAVFIAIQKLQISAVALLISTIMATILGFFFLNSGFGSFGAVYAFIFGQIICVFILLIFLYRKKLLSISPFYFRTTKELILGSLPYGFLGILGLLYFRIDVILLSYLKGNFDAGIYSVAYKFLESIIFIPGTFAAALFPVLAKFNSEDIKKAKVIYFKSMKVMLGVGLLIFLIYLILLPEIIRIFIPNYSQTIEVMRILSFAIPFIFIATPGVQVLFSSKNYLRQVILLSILTLGFNIILNLFFIPKYSFIASAWITVVSEILSFIIFFLYIKYKIFQQK